MAAKARLETVLTGDDSPFIQAINRAEKRAQTFSGRMQGLFRRDPSARAERALGSFVGDLATGNVGGAIEGIATRMRGLGLAAGVGIGAAALIFQKAKQQIDEVGEAVKKVDADLARPVHLVSALGPEGITKEFEQASQHLEQLAEKRKGLFQQSIEWVGRQVAARGNLNPMSIGFVGASLRAESEQGKEIERLGRLTRARAEEELKIVDAREIGLKQSEREGQHAKLYLDARKKVAALILESAANREPPSVFVKRFHAIAKDTGLSRAGIDEKFSQQGFEGLLSRQAAFRALRLDSPERQRIGQLQDRLLSARERLKGDLPLEERNRYGTEEILARAGLRQERFTKFFQTPGQQLTEGIQESRRQGMIQEFTRAGGLRDVHRDMGGRIISGTDPLTGGMVKLGQPSPLDMPRHADGQGSGEVVAAVKELSNKLSTMIDLWR